MTALPPGPSELPLMQMWRWTREPFSFLARCRAAHGDTFTVRLLGYSPVVFTCDPAMVHAVFTEDPAIMLAGKGNDVLLPFLGEHALITLDGPRHARDRRLMTPPLHGQRMRAYGEAIRLATQRAIADWRPGQEVVSHRAMQAASLEVIVRAVFGVEEDAEIDATMAALTALLNHVSPAIVFFNFLRRDLGPWSPWGRYLQSQARAEKLLLAQVERRRAHPGEDILSLLLAARDEHNQPLTDEELYGELVTLLVAGHETTATALCWALAWLGAEPAVYAQLQAELDQSGDDPDQISKLPYLSAFCNEVLRFYPVFPIVMRVLGADWSYGNYHIPAEHRVAPCIRLVHTRADLYPEPERFRPERFIERSYGPHEFFPFGGGARRCIGAAFALYEMKLALTTVLRTVRLGVTPPPQPARRNIAIAPADGARVKIVGRHTALT